MQDFDIYFSGQLKPDGNMQLARQGVAKLFKADDKALERLFSGKPIRIARAVDVEKANRLRASFLKIDALIDVVPHGAPAPQPRPTSTASKKPTSAIEGSAQATPAAQAKAETKAETETESGSGMSLLPARTGSLEDCATRVEAQSIPDISAIALAETNSLEDCAPEIEAREIADISGITIAEPGTRLYAPPPTPDADIDISSLSMAAANSGSLEDCASPREPQAIPDISHLQIDDRETST